MEVTLKNVEIVIDTVILAYWHNTIIFRPLGDKIRIVVDWVTPDNNSKITVPLRVEPRRILY